MAWLPSAVPKVRVKGHPCLICNLHVPENHTHSTVEPEVINVVCHLLHVDWQVLGRQTKGKYPLCRGCSRVIVDLSNIWEEIQLTENELRNKVGEIRTIVESQFGLGKTAGQKSSRKPNALQKHFIEDSQVNEMIQLKLSELGSDAVKVEPSLVQLHFDIKIKPTRNKDRKYIQPGKSDTKGRGKRKKAGMEPSLIVPDMGEDGMEFKTEPPDPTDETPIADEFTLVAVTAPEDQACVINDVSSMAKNTPLKGEAEVIDVSSDSDYIPSDSEDGGITDGDEDWNEKSGVMSVAVQNDPTKPRYFNPKTGKKSMVAMRKPWKMETKKDGRKYFKGIELIKKPADPKDSEKIRFIVECGSCGKQFSQQFNSKRSGYSSVKIHIVADHLGMTKCEPCKRTFVSPRALEAHLSGLLHHRRNPTQALKKPEVGISPRLKRKGVTVDSNGKMLYNEIEIIKTLSAEGFDLTCGKCHEIIDWEEAHKKKRDSFTLMVKHINIKHTGIYDCSVCGNKYTDPRNLETHFFNRHTLDPPKIFCTICAKPLRHPYSVKKHMWTHKSTEDAEAAIAAGERPPSTFKQNVQQRREKLGADSMFQCSQCGKTFKFECQMKLHEKRHNPKVYECGACGSVFPTPQKREQHAQEIHNSKKIGRYHYCKTCPEYFKTRSQLTKHEDRHNSTMPFSCDYCSERFVLQCSLFTHLKKCTSQKSLELSLNMLSCDESTPQATYEVVFLPDGGAAVSTSKLEDVEMMQ